MFISAQWLAILQAATAITQVIATLVIVATLIVYWRQLLAMKDQVASMREAARGENLIKLVDYLARPGLAEKRSALMRMCGKRLDEWSEDERRNAWEVIGAYDLAGMMVRYGLVAEDVVADNWGSSIRKCFEAASELLSEWDEDETRGPKYRHNFRWLAHRITSTQNILASAGRSSRQMQEERTLQLLLQRVSREPSSSPNH